MTIKCTASGDLDISSANLVPLDSSVDLAAYVAQHVPECLSLFAGENYLDTREGFPYFRVAQTRPDMALLRSLYLRAIKAVPGVADVGSVVLAYDGRTRTLSVSAGPLTLTSGAVLPNVAFLVPWIATQSGGAS